MRQIRRFLHKSGSPITFGLIGLAVVSLILLFLGSGSKATFHFADSLAFNPVAPFERPWTFLTYTLIVGDLNALLCIGLGLYFFTSALERRFGSRKFGIAFLGLVLLSPLSIWLGHSITGVVNPLYGLALPVAATIIAWATLSPTATVLLMMVFPVPAWLIGIFTFAGVVLGFGMGAPIMGFCAAIPLVAGFFLARSRFNISLPQSKPKSKSSGDYQGRNFEKSREAERERLRLKELFERSWSEGDEGPSEK